jgi:integrase
MTRRSAIHRGCGRCCARRADDTRRPARRRVSARLGGQGLQAASKSVERWKLPSVNLALAPLDSFYTQIGLTDELQRRLLRMAERASVRDRAIVVTLLYTGLRLAELVALDLDDVRVSACKGLVVVRSRSFPHDRRSASSSPTARASSARDSRPCSTSCTASASSPSPRPGGRGGRHARARRRRHSYGPAHAAPSPPSWQHRDPVRSGGRRGRAPPTRSRHERRKS